MKTVLIFGASATHGVGGEFGGWADKIKLWLHKNMYSAVSQESFYVYELGIPGNTARDVVSRFESEILARLSNKKPEDCYIIFSAGTNDSKAVDKPDNYLYTPDEYATNVQAFIRLAKEHAKHVLCVGLTPIDQKKAGHFVSPMTGQTYYHTNQRIQSFEHALEQACKKEKVKVQPIFAQVPKNWEENYLYKDGLHPNEAGHQWIFEQVKPALQKMLGLKK